MVLQIQSMQQQNTLKIDNTRQPQGNPSPVAAASSSCSSSLRDSKIEKLDFDAYLKIKEILQKGTEQEVLAAMPKLKMLGYLPIDEALRLKRHDITLLLYQHGLPLSDVGFLHLTFNNNFEVLEDIFNDSTNTFKMLSDDFFTLIQECGISEERISLIEKILERGVELTPRRYSLRSLCSMRLAELLVKYKCPLYSGVVGDATSVDVANYFIDQGAPCTSEDVESICLQQKDEESWIPVLERIMSKGGGATDRTIAFVIDEGRYLYLKCLLDHGGKPGDISLAAALEPGIFSWGGALKEKNLDLFHEFIRQGAVPGKRCMWRAILSCDLKVFNTVLDFDPEHSNDHLDVLLNHRRGNSCWREMFFSLLDKKYALTDEHLSDFCRDLTRDELDILHIILGKVDVIPSSVLEKIGLLNDHELAYDVAKTFIDKGAEPTSEALCSSAERGNEPLCNLLIEYGAKADTISVGKMLMWQQNIKDIITYYFDISISIYDFFGLESNEKLNLLLDEIVNRLPADLQKKKNVRDKVKRLIKMFEDEIFHEEICFGRTAVGHFDALEWITNSIRYHGQYGMSLEEFGLMTQPCKYVSWRTLFPHFNLLIELLHFNPYGFDQNLYNSILPEMEEASKVEGNESAKLHALKLSTLLDSVTEIREYLSSYKKAHPNVKQPVHDACLFELPEWGVWSISTWRKMLQREGYSKKWMQILPFAATIERAMNGPLTPVSLKMSEIGCQWNGKGGIPSLLTKAYKEELQTLAGHKGGVRLWESSTTLLAYEYAGFVQQKIRAEKNKILPSLQKEDEWKDKTDVEQVEEAFKRAAAKVEEWIHTRPLTEFIHFNIKSRILEQYTLQRITDLVATKVYHDVPEQYSSFAVECVRHGISRKYFDEAIAIIRKMPKKEDYIPAVRISGEVIRESGWIMEKISDTDPIAFILGEKTSCCQSIHSSSRDCVLHGATSSFGGFYCIKIRKAKEQYVAQSWVGITEDYELIFDSIEWNRIYDPKKIMEMYLLAATDILDRHPEIPRVLLGGGGNTPLNDGFRRQSRRESYSRIVGYKSVGYDSVSSRFVLAEQGNLDPTRLDIVRAMDHSKVKEGQRSEVTSDGLTIVQGVDTYFKKGKILSELTLDPSKRVDFYSNHPKVRELLWSHHKNPLLEQGYYKGNSREHYGEPFIPFSALEILVHDKLRKGNIPVTHTIFVDNDIAMLTENLKGLHLDEGDNALVGYVDDVHSYSLYLQRYEGKLQAILVDSEPLMPNDELEEALMASLQGVTLVKTVARLQLDYYSCTTIAIKAMLLFAREGKDLLPELCKDFSEPGIFVLPPQKTPLGLLKLSQSALVSEEEEAASLKHFITIPAALFDANISQKKVVTLRDYLSANIVYIGSKSYNAALLRKKYRYLEQLELSLCQNRNF